MYDEELKSNQTLIYKVTFPTQNPVPKVKGIYYNEQLICSGPEGLLSSILISRIVLISCL